MAHNALIHSGGWAPGYVLTQADCVAIDTLLFKALNADDGGTWAPSSLIEIGGSGLRLTTALNLAATAVVSCAAGSKISGALLVDGTIQNTGAGHRIDRSITGVNADHTYAIADADDIALTSAISADHVYTFSNTGAVNGCKMRIWNAGCVFKITMHQAGGGLLGVIANPATAVAGEYTSMDIQFLGSDWQVSGGIRVF